MSAESAVSATIAEFPRLWPVGFFRYRIEYNAEVLETIRTQALQACRDDSHRSASTCGLLLGRHDAAKVQVLSLRPLNFAQLAGLDRGRLDADNAPDGLLFLGFYSIGIGDEVSLSREEAQIFADLFRQPWQFAMIVRPADSQIVRAGLFFLHSNGSIYTDSGLRDVLLAPPPEIAPAPAERKQAQIAPGPRSTRVLFKWFALGAAVVVGLLVWPVWQRRPFWETENSARPDEMVVSLTAQTTREKSGTLIRLAWNPSAPRVRSASFGTLHIVDGALQRHLFLRREALSLGHIDYPAASDAVTFQLALNGDTSRMDSLLVVFGSSHAGDSRSGLPEVRQDTTAKIVPVAGSQKEEPIVPQVVLPETPKTPIHKPIDLPKPVDRHPPAGPGLIAAHHQIPAAIPSLAPPPEIAAPRPAVAAGSAITPRIDREAPAPGKAAPLPVKVDFVAPQVTRRVLPVLPQSMRRLAASNIRVSLQVQIDAEGKVTASRLASSAAGANKYLAVAAQDAVKHWQFSPARLGGRPVPGEVVVEFEFPGKP